MKKNIHKYLAILPAAVMACTALTLVACNPNSLGKNTDTETEKTTPGLSLETKSSPFLSLSATTKTRATTNGNVLEHILTATVLPETAENKKVEWAMDWEDPTCEENLDEYVRLTVGGDEGNVATVTCYKPFDGNVVITVTTVEGGFTAQCICKYVGIPSAMDVDMSNANIVHDAAWGTDVVEIGQTTTYHDIELSNIFGEPGAEFTPEYDIELTPHGGITAIQSTYAADGSLIGTEEIELSIQIMDYMEKSGHCVALVRHNTVTNYAYVGIKEGQLFIAGQKYPEAMSWKKTNDDGTFTQTVFSGYVDGKEPYVGVTLTEKNTGLTYTFNVRTVGTVNNVNLDFSEIIF